MLFKVGEPKWNLGKRVWRKLGLDPLRNRVGAEIEFFGRTSWNVHIIGHDNHAANLWVLEGTFPSEKPLNRFILRFPMILIG